MSSASKEHLKSLKQPDQFQVKAMALMDFLLKNTKVMAGIVAVAALVVGGVYAARVFSNKARDGRLEELGKVQVVYEAEQKKAQTAREAIQKQIEAVEAKAKPAAAVKPGEPAAPPSDPKVQAEIDDLTKKAEAVKADHTESAQKFAEFFKKNDSNAEGWMAGLQAARLDVDLGKPAEAQPLLEQVLDKSKGNQFYQVQARLALISVLEDAGNYDKALAEVDTLDKLVDKEMKPRVLLAKGRIQMLKNQKTEAKATFNSLIEQHGTSPEAQKARSIEALLN
jgi:predicted negative regulator of RcsB-dependent stress response